MAGVCIFQTFTSSTTFRITPTELVYKNDYSTNYDSLPQNNVNIIELNTAGHFNSLNFDLSGLYVKANITSNANSLFDLDINPKYMWLNDSKNIILCFSTYDLYILSTNNYELIQSLKYTYNDAQIKTYNNTGHHSSYLCKFRYNNQISLGSSQDHDFEKGNAEYINKSSKTTTSKDKTNAVLISFLKKYVLPHFWSKVVALFFSLLLAIFIINRFSSILYHKYKRNLKSALFPQEHTWFGNNSPTDIYISAKVYIENTYHEYNLLEYFSSAFLQPPSNYVILGNAGEGKTFSMSRLIMAILDCFSFSKTKKAERKKIKDLIPILLNFSQLSNCNTRNDIIDFVYQKIVDTAKLKNSIIGKILYFKYKTKTIKAIEKYFDSGKFIVFIDGYDEIESTQTRLYTSRVITEFMSIYNKCNFVISSRTQIYENERFNTIPTENTLYLSPLTKEQIHEFVTKWNYPEGKSYSDLFQRIINTRQLEEMVTNPLLLTMITHTYCNSEISGFTSKTQLYKACCDCLLSEWERKKTFFRRIKRYTTIDNIEVKSELLCTMAFKLYLTGDLSLSEKELLSLWSTHPHERVYFHGKTKNVLDELINESSILERINDRIKFHHNSFYEYFCALYILKNDFNVKSLYANVLNNSEILFFYFSMVHDESIVIDFISSNPKYNKLICNILLERKITNSSVVQNALSVIISQVSYINTSEVLILGYIAKQYPYLSIMVKDALVHDLSLATEQKEKVNIIMGLMVFCDENLLSMLINSTSSYIDMEHLVKYSGESINDFAYTIIQLLQDPAEKFIFIESLARSYRFDAIYNIYKKGKKEYKDLSIIGILYMSKEPELLNWLAAKKFSESISEKKRQEALSIKEKYGWEDNELSDKAQSNLFTLIYLSKHVIKNGLHPNIELIENKIAFLLSLLISDAIGEPYYDLVKIDNINMKSTVELKYHWNRIRKGKKEKFHFKQKLINTVNIDRIINVLFAFIVLVMTLVVVFNRVNIYELHNQGWIYSGNSNNHSIIPLNALYIILLGTIFAATKLFGKIINKYEYSLFTIAAHCIFSLIVFLLYSFITQNIIFRSIILIFIMLNCILEIIKHKNNYPSFKEPQYSKIVNFLDDGVHFYDIHIG